MATLSSSTSEAMLPIFISPDSPLRPAISLPGTPQSGAMRGNSMNSTSMIGAPSSDIQAAVRML